MFLFHTVTTGVHKKGRRLSKPGTKCTLPFNGHQTLKR